MKITMVLFAALIAAVVILACGSEKTTPVQPPQEEFASLSVKDHVITNLELVHNEFSDTEYDRLLDRDFVFIFSAVDYREGRTPELWSREIETRFYRGFFDPNRSENRVVSRDVVLTDTVEVWHNITPDTLLYPGETWHEKTVAYNVTVVIDQVDPSGSPVELVTGDRYLHLTIRWDATRGHWRLVRWQDDVRPGAAKRVARIPGGVPTVTWGYIKGGIR
jgi:hypothetical protein